MNAQRLSIFCLLLVIVGTATANGLAELRLPQILGDHMVLQQNQPVPIWGWAQPGQQVTVELGDRMAMTTADEDGRWRVQLDPPEAGGPYQLTILGESAIKFHDILVGEVWVCSGQSNMQWTVQQAMNSKEEIAAADCQVPAELWRATRHGCNHQIFWPLFYK